MEDDQPMVWQSVMLIVRNRIDCQCGARALFIILDGETERNEKRDLDYTAWCQDCWRKEQER